MMNKEEILRLKNHPMNEVYTKKATEFLKKALDQLSLDQHYEVKDDEGREVHHVVMVFEDLNDPDFSEWALKISKRTIEEHRELENPGVLIVSFMGDEVVGTRVMDIDEALSLISRERKED
jgi:hypothetical protein